jgi:serine/threonine-protein kinase
MYEMATGRLPFAGPSPFETITNIFEKDPVPLTTLAPERPKAIERVVTRLLAKRLEDRYESAATLIQDLTQNGPRRPIRSRAHYAGCSRRTETSALLPSLRGLGGLPCFSCFPSAASRRRDAACAGDW